MPINTPYASISEADLTLGETTPWANSEDEDKSYALQIARSFIDTKYTCVSFDEDNAPDPIKIANAELANIYLTSPDNFFGDNSSPGLKRKRVKAGSVETEKEFDVYQTTPADLYPRITAILSEYCKMYGAASPVTR